MKTIDEKKLRYIADIMDENEKKNFEKQILNSYELKSELENMQNRLSSLKVDPALLDEKYFANMLPKLHQKLEAEGKSYFAEKIYYLVPYVAAGIIGLIFLFKPTNNFDFGYKDLADKVVNHITDQDVAKKYFDEIDTEPSLLETPNNDDSFGVIVPSNLDFNGEDASKILNISVSDEYSTLNNYTDDQLEEIASDLNKLNIK